MTSSRFSLFARIFAIGSALILGACSKPKSDGSGSAARSAGLAKVRFQTDWYPQGEHGGNYQALAKGYYQEAGLDVEILPGGPGPNVAQKMIAGAADVAMSRSDDVLLSVEAGLPFVVVGALMQHDPQAILLHAESAVQSFSDLKGKTIMAVPGAAWVQYVKARYEIDFPLVPLNYGFAQFISDKNFIQQCFITNEPYFVGQQGVKTRTLLISDSGYNPYRVYFTTQRFAREHPQEVRAFVAASIRGWNDFVDNDPAPAKKLIIERNKQMSEGFLDFTIEALRKYQLVKGKPEDGEQTGLIKRHRLQEQSTLLVKLGLVKEEVPLERYVSFDFLPPELKARIDQP